MREIKFRGKRFDNGEWAYGYYWSNHLGNHFIKITKDDDEDYCLFDVEVDPETVCEYTGLKDKNSKEIYEGDIFNIGDRNIRCKVVYQNTSFKGKAIFAGIDMPIESFRWNYEFIGNVFDNSELLKVGAE